MSPLIKLISSDEREFSVSVDVVKCSQTIMSMLENCDNAEEPVLLSRVAGDVLEKVLFWAEHHNKVVKGEAPEMSKEWNDKFLDVGKDTLFDLVRAANFLDVPDLLDLTCKAVFEKTMMGKTSQEIRKIYGLDPNSA